MGLLMRKQYLVVLVLGLWFRTLAQTPLASWNDRPARQSVLDFVDAVTRPAGPQFVDPSGRIAVFDNDGTLWCEQPMYVQLVFALDRVKALAPAHPEWKARPALRAAMTGDLKTLAAGGEHALLELIMATHSGTTTEEFEGVVRQWIATARHPKTGRLYSEMVYQPMLELLAYLREHGFKVYIVSGGGVEFMRPWSERVYGIPSRPAISSPVKEKYGFISAPGNLNSK